MTRSLDRPAAPRLAIPERARPREVPGWWLALLAAPLATGSNSLALVLPRVAGDLGAGVGTATWLVTTFGWAVAIGTPLMAGLVRRRGLRVTLLFGALLVTAGALLAGLAATLPLLLLGRAFQAIGGAGLVTVAMNLAGSTRRMGLITASFGACGAVGPLAGSLVADAASWHLSLALSAVSLLAVPAVTRFLPAAIPGKPVGRFDSSGALLLVALASALVFVPRFPPAAAAAVLAAALLAFRIRARPDGFVPASVVREPAFLLAAGIACALSTSYFALLYAAPALMKHDLGWTTGQVGVAQLVALLAGSGLSLGLSAISARMSRPVLLTVLIGLGALAALIAATGPWPFLLLAVPALAVFAASAGQATLAVSATAAVPGEHRPTAIGLFNLCYQLGGAFGPAIAALLALG
ncbi:MFS transporter [Amycolatopsis anabasis]|uniref:MFS transporter n=1 Tax=Amycolatopsis anabasis TaxID=1840409 RepID=UPI00131D0C90|nr:MFS transporter [Amycolatopsis anabasis]